MSDPILLLSRKKKKRVQLSEVEKAEVLKEMEKPIELKVKVTSYVFENWLERQVQRAELRVLEAERTNKPFWIRQDIYQKKMQLRQAEINFLALIYP